MLALKLDVPVGSVDLATPTIQIDSGQIISALRLDIQDMNGIPYEEQLLLYSKNTLDDSRTLEFYGIRDEHKIQLSKQTAFLLNFSLLITPTRHDVVHRLPGKLPVIFHVDGKEVTLHLQLGDNVFKIKQLLVSKGLPAVANLMLGSARIDDNATVKEAGLTAFCSVYCMFCL